MARRHFVPGIGKLMPSGRRGGRWRAPRVRLNQLEQPLQDFRKNVGAEYTRAQEKADDRRFEAFAKRLGQQFSATGKAEGTIQDLKGSHPEEDAEEIVQRLHRHGYRAVRFAPFGEDKKRGIRIVGWVNR